MKDNNDAKVSSDDDEQGYFVELEGDNINTPIVELKVDNNSILIGENVNFQAKVRNVLGQDISSASEYFWDFDGDGIYEKKTNTPQISHTFKKS
jgi:PKD repeat protein